MNAKKEEKEEKEEHEEEGEKEEDAPCVNEREKKKKRGGEEALGDFMCIGRVYFTFYLMVLDFFGVGPTWLHSYMDV